MKASSGVEKTFQRHPPSFISANNLIDLKYFLLKSVIQDNKRVQLPNTKIFFFNISLKSVTQVLPKYAKLKSSNADVNFPGLGNIHSTRNNWRNWVWKYRHIGIFYIIEPDLTDKFFLSFFIGFISGINS